MSVITGRDDDRLYEPTPDRDDAAQIRRRRPRSEDLIRAAQELPQEPSVPDDELASLVFPESDANANRRKPDPPERI